MSWKEAVVKSLGEKFNRSVELVSSSWVGGGSINDTFYFETSAGDFFVKKNSSSRYPEMFEKEAKGLKLLAGTNEIPVPEVILTGEENDDAFLILKFIKSSPKKDNFWNSFAEKLAKLHKHTSDSFGLDHNNYIGSLPQLNLTHEKWTDFFREERLHPQVKSARDNGLIGIETVKTFDRFYTKLDEIFPVENPALIHGDLWGGNFMVDEIGEAVIIDPAVYFGHREMDIAMSKLFGGFSREFYEAYNHFYPLEKDWKKRMDFCNLYPLLVHANLFGGGYAMSVKNILREF